MMIMMKSTTRVIILITPMAIRDRNATVALDATCTSSNVENCCDERFGVTFVAAKDAES